MRAFEESLGYNITRPLLLHLHLTSSHNYPRGHNGLHHLINADSVHLATSNQVAAEDCTHYNLCNRGTVRTLQYPSTPRN